MQQLFYRDAPDQSLDPQTALWLARGFLVVVILVPAYVMIREPRAPQSAGAPQAATATDIARDGVTSLGATDGGSGATTAVSMVASVSGAASRAAVRRTPSRPLQEPHDGEGADGRLQTAERSTDETGDGGGEAQSSRAEPRTGVAGGAERKVSATRRMERRSVRRTPVLVRGARRAGRAVRRLFRRIL